MSTEPPGVDPSLAREVELLARFEPGLQDAAAQAVKAIRERAGDLVDSRVLAGELGLSKANMAALIRRHDLGVRDGGRVLGSRRLVMAHLSRPRRGARRQRP